MCHILPIVMAYTPQNMWYTPCYWNSTKFGYLSIIFIVLDRYPAVNIVELIRDVKFGIKIGSDWPKMGQVWNGVDYAKQQLTVYARQEFQIRLKIKDRLAIWVNAGANLTSLLNGSGLAGQLVDKQCSCIWISAGCRKFDLNIQTVDKPWTSTKENVHKQAMGLKAVIFHKNYILIKKNVGVTYMLSGICLSFCMSDWSWPHHWT